MPNVNFKNFQQIGNLVTDIVKQATGRDPVQNLDMDYVSVAQNKKGVEHIIGFTNIASFVNNNNSPLTILAKIEAVQSGTGTPSPENEREITGWTKCVITQYGDDPESANTFTIEFPENPGTVYGGELDVTNGVLTVNRAIRTFNGSEQWTRYASSNNNFRFHTSVLEDRLVSNDANGTQFSNYLATTTGIVSSGGSIIITGTRNSVTLMSVGVRMYVYVPDIVVAEDDLNGWKTYLSEHPLQVCYLLATPLVFNVEPTVIQSLIGENNISADTGDIAVKYNEWEDLN